MQFFRFLVIGFSILIAAAPLWADSRSAYTAELRKSLCISALTRSGELLQFGPGCPDQIEVESDCITIILPGSSQIIDGFDQPVWNTETVLLGTDCGPELPTQPQPQPQPQSIIPTIENTTIPWNGPNFERKFTATLAPGSGYIITAVYLKQTRHHWPGTEAAHHFPAIQVGNGNTYVVVPPLNETWIRADTVFYEWHVEYVSETTGEAGKSKSNNSNEPDSFVLNCTNAQIQSTLTQLAIFARTNFNDNVGMNPGYPIPSHMVPWISLENQGMPYATPQAIADINQVSAALPSLLLFHPGPGDGAQKLFGTRLAGVAYGQFYGSATRRPSMDCVPSSEWFVHEAGWHTFDGGMELLDIQEVIPGQTPGTLLPPEPKVGAWHPRLWDLHVWLPPNSGIAVLSIESPTAISGVPVEEGSFFYPETFE